MDGIMLAEAGLRRLGYSVGNVLEIEGVALQVHCLPEKEFYPAAGQGAVGFEIRSDDSESRDIISALNHQKTWDRVTAERGFLELLSAGCNTPVGVWCEISEGLVTMGARVYPETGGEPTRAEVSAPLAEAAQLLFQELS
jgi:hydroxymethylbilane synthase